MLRGDYMKTNNNIPAYRFQGYTDAWELRKLGEVAPLRGGFAFKSSDFVKEGIPIVRISNILSNGRVGAEFVHYKELDQDERFTLHDGAAVLAMSGATTGKVSVLHVDEGEKYYQNQRVGYFTPTPGYNYDFIKVIVNSTFFTTQLSSVLVAGAQPNISSKEVDDFCFAFPKSLPEQEAIGTFFSTLDQHITLHQRKLDTLKEQKKTYLKLLFPAKGQAQPALRFQGFEDDWEVKRISDIGDIVTGNTPSTSNEDYYSNEGMMWVTPTDIDGLIITDTNKKLSPEGEKVSRIVPANSILVTCIASIGKNTLLLEAGSFNQQINAVVPNQSLYHSYFLLTQSHFWSESMKRIAPAATMQIINKNEFS
ncbi:TPA: restriction endonuclease subunit S, partial [Streptococcus suis]|nr:restriction endonuclease subunit S [Streptococcus suis]